MPQLLDFYAVMIEFVNDLHLEDWTTSVKLNISRIVWINNPNLSKCTQPEQFKTVYHNFSNNITNMEKK